MDGLPALFMAGPAVLLLAGFVKGRSLCNAVIVTLPFDSGVWWEYKEALDCLPIILLEVLQDDGRATYLILMFLPPSILVQTLNTSSPLRTLSTAPQTSSPASINWSPMIASNRSSQ